MVGCCWLLVVGCWLLFVVGCWLFVVCWLLVGINYQLSIINYQLSIINNQQPTINHQPINYLLSGKSGITHVGGAMRFCITASSAIASI